NGFSTGIGYGYGPSSAVQAVDTQKSTSIITGSDYLSDILRKGQRLLDSVVMRYANGNPRYLQDADFHSTGRYQILVFLATDLLDASSVSCAAVAQICED
ncbi:hypothetical protein BJ878DRAFT_416646, partial [Calycina marina]